MKKIRKYLDKVNIFLIVFAMVFSVFFHVPMNVSASGNYYSEFSYSGSTAESGLQFSTMASKRSDLIFDAPFEEDSFYEISVRTELNMDSTQALNFRIPYVSVGDYLFLLGENVNNSTVYNVISEKTFCISGEDLIAGFPVWIKCYMWNNNLDFNLEGNLKIQLLSYKKISSEVSDTYEQGYNQGFEEGEAFGYSDGYSSGFSDGENKGFSDGFEAGKDSVDTDSIYMEGYEAGREVAYVEGYDEGYAKGYAEALTVNTTNTSGLVAGDTITLDFSKQYSDELDIGDFNTRFPTIVSADFNKDYLILDGFQTSNGDYCFSGDIELSTYNEYFGYHQTPPSYMCMTSSDVYAYYITVIPSRVSYSSSWILENRLVLGTMDDILSGDGMTGNSFANGVKNESRFWYVNDYAKNPLYFSYLVRFFYDENNGATCSFSLGWDFKVNLTPYTKEEYNASVSAIEKQTLEMKEQFNDLKHGFDTSSGDVFNEDFQASLIDYQVAEDSLFQSATDGLSNFEFFDFQSVPAVVSGISFVTALMTSVFGAMGGIDGIGIILSVLFSVMLVSMVLGIYRFYQSNGKSNGKSSGKGGSKSGGSKGGKSP